MNKLLIAGLLLVLAAIISGLYLSNNKSDDLLNIEDLELNTGVSSPVNATYSIGEESFTLINGSAEKEIVPGSTVKNSVFVFGEPAYGDIDGDGDDDAVVLLVNNTGGTGLFYYAAIAVNADGEYIGTDTRLLGDRIAPQTFYVEGNKAVINYVDRIPGESFAVPPSVGKNVYLQFDPENLRLIEIAVDFEGEADPAKMTLDMKTWHWIKTTYNNDTEIMPIKPEAFSLTFKPEGTVSVTTDCNTMNGTYNTENKKITFEQMAATLMYCEGSQEQPFSSMLGEVQSYFFTSKGELVFNFKLDSGSATFR